jgi:23S rRNA (pseudouridine1915-N3)-methyltransferase
MLITIAAVGKLKAGPERDLLDRYIDRASAVGRTLSLTCAVREIPDSRADSAATRKRQEGAAILAAVPAGAIVVALDEGGKSIASADFATRLAAWRDGGTPGVAFAIGGADGHDRELIQRAQLRLAFGAMTWPHQFVRIMLAEQIYRAMTIISGHPYHRA